MNTCDTCKHWNKDFGYEGFKVCDVLDKQRNSDDNTTITFSGSSDEDRNVLNTHSKFGCLHHEWNQAPKELLEQLVWEIFQSKGINVSEEICKEVVEEVTGFTSTTEDSV